MFRQFLEGKIENVNTRDKYYYAVTAFFKKLQFNNLGDIDAVKIKEMLKDIKGKSKFSAIKNGLKYLKMFDDTLNIPDEKWFNEISKTKKNHSTRAKKNIYYDEVMKKINAIKNEKMKFAFRLMAISGLRVYETSKLKKENISVEDNKIFIIVEHGKGGSNGIVECIPDSYLIDKLPNYLEKFDDTDNIFYAAQTMKKKANELNIECHNFRRIAAIKFKKIQKENGRTKEEADDNTRIFLRHERFSTTKRYLYNRKLSYKEKKEKETILPDFFDYMSEEQKKINLKALKKLTEKEREIYYKSLQNEKEITNDIVKIIEDSGGEMKGLQKRIKTPQSVYEKRYERTSRTSIKKMCDIIRYTGIYDIENLTSCTINNLEVLKQKGYKTIKIKNTWIYDTITYKGINIIIENPKGQIFELQVHTEESFNLKENEIHRLYEKTRKLDIDSEELIEINKEMINLSNQLKKPKNIGDLK